jgi:hypothetical protein
VNKNLRIKDNEFSDMRNITNDFFPAIGNRKKRGMVTNLVKPQAILGGKYITWVDDNKLYYDENYICDLDDLDVERQIAIIGAYLCVLPDGIIYNVYDKSITRMDNTVTTQGNPTFTLCKLDGTAYDSSNTVTSDTEPEDKTKYWIDTSQDPVVMKMYSENLSMWTSVATTYVKVEATGIGVGFKSYDAATLSGCDEGFGYNNYDFNQSSILYEVGDNYIIIAGFINMVHTNSKPVTVERKHPSMDFVCECNNRLWGCSSDNHEIYACKQGDPTNWNFFGGLDSDSYAATVGTHNDFTGCIAYNSTVYFFKEDGFHKLYGSKPSNYEMMWKPCRGIQKGSEKSLAYIDEYLMWKSRDAVVLFDGNADTVSVQLGIEPLYEGVAGAYRNKYFISLRDENYVRRLYVYDITKGTWCIEDEVTAIYMANANNGFYLIDSSGQVMVINAEKIYTKFFPEDDLYPEEELFPGNISNGVLEDKIEWSMTTGDIGMDTPYMKYIKRVDVRLLIDTDASIKFEVEYDSSDAWKNVFEYVCTRKRSYTIPISVQRCDHMKLRMSGSGDVRIFSIAIVKEDGSDGDI